MFFQESAMGAELLRKAGMIAALVIAGCASYPSAPGEVYEVSQLRVIFLDEEQIREKWEEVSGKSSGMITPRLVMESRRQEEVVTGFYDFRTRTIYCPKMNFEVCGHELHHAVLGRFHLDQLRTIKG